MVEGTQGSQKQRGGCSMNEKVRFFLISCWILLLLLVCAVIKGVEMPGELPNTFCLMQLLLLYNWQERDYLLRTKIMPDTVGIVVSMCVSAGACVFCLDSISVAPISCKIFSVANVLAGTLTILAIEFLIFPRNLYFIYKDFRILHTSAPDNSILTSSKFRSVFRSVVFVEPTTYKNEKLLAVVDGHSFGLTYIAFCSFLFYCNDLSLNYVRTIILSICAVSIFFLQKFLFSNYKNFRILQEHISVQFPSRIKSGVLIEPNMCVNGKQMFAINCSYFLITIIAGLLFRLN
jgi:hypothetical protein